MKPERIEHEDFVFSDEKQDSFISKPKKSRAFMMTRSPGSKAPIRVSDDENPDEVIEKFIAEGKDTYYEKYHPEIAQQYRDRYVARLEKERNAKDRSRKRKNESH